MDGSAKPAPARLDPRKFIDSALTLAGERRASVTLDALKTLVGWEPKLATQILFDLGRILSLRLRQTTLLITKWTG